MFQIPPPLSSPSLWEGEDIGGGGIWNLLGFRIWNLNKLDLRCRFEI